MDKNELLDNRAWRERVGFDNIEKHPTPKHPHEARERVIIENAPAEKSICIRDASGWCEEHSTFHNVKPPVEKPS